MSIAFNLFDEDPLATWQTEAYYLAARRRVLGVIAMAEIGIIEISAGGQLLPHVQPKDMTVVCIAGEGQHTDGHRETPVRWGDVLEIAGKEIRGFTATGDNPLYLLTLHPLLEDTPPTSLAQLALQFMGRLPK